MRIQKIIIAISHLQKVAKLSFGCSHENTKNNYYNLNIKMKHESDFYSNANWRVMIIIKGDIFYFSYVFRLIVFTKFIS